MVEELWINSMLRRAMVRGQGEVVTGCSTAVERPDEFDLNGR